MRSAVWVVAAALGAGTSATAGAQPASPAMSSIELAVACAPPPSFSAEPEHAQHVAGAQDSAPRAIFGGHDLLVLDGGTKAGLQLGQQFFVRRPNSFGTYHHQPAYGRGAKTLGWVHVVAANESTAIAQIDHTCGDILTGDYLEAFVPPVVPAGAESTDTAGEPDFGDLGRIVNGVEDRTTFGGGDFALIDRGSDQGVVPGQRYAIYRDLRKEGLPLVSVGEAIVVSTSGSAALARITAARDAVFEGDYVARRK
ncbi:MAG TPA: hypothetical protein VKE51_42010 [Vicinamibacterales bacterium]|nr:hypothetical protein [Vicinamibacterales bacterium]